MRALYWDIENLEKPIKVYNHETGLIDKEVFEKSVLKSDNPLVSSVFITGSTSQVRNSDIYTTLHIISGEIKPGLHPDNEKVKRFNKIITDNQVKSLDIPEAIEWINNLKPEE